MQDILSWLLSLNLTDSPLFITPQIEALCRELVPEYEPVFVPVTPSEDAKTGECFRNVLEKVARDGGEILYGWAIWEWPRVFIEAEHHAVWSKGGCLTDVTPQVPPADRILFLPDPERAYDYENKRLNIKRSLGLLKATDRWLEASDRLQQYILHHTRGNEVTLDRRVSVLHNEAQSARVEIFFELARTTKRNDPCFCGSGRKFKKCCGPKFEAGAGSQSVLRRASG